MEDNSQREYVAGWLKVNRMSKVNDFRGYVSRRSTTEEKIFRKIYIGRKAKVYNHWFEVSFPNHDVLRF